MNPNYEQPSLSLPELHSGTEPTTVKETTQSTTPEVRSGQLAQPAVPTPAAPQLPAFSPMPSASVQPMSPVPITATPSLADDGDLIEKEWVTRAKAIVEHTKEDPREQTREMNYFKADYLKKRYNKDIKVSES